MGRGCLIGEGEFTVITTSISGTPSNIICTFSPTANGVCEVDRGTIDFAMPVCHVRREEKSKNWISVTETLARDECWTVG